VSLVSDSLPPNTKLAVFDAVTSNTALVLPVQQLVQLCRDRYALVGMGALLWWWGGVSQATQLWCCVYSSWCSRAEVTELRGCIPVVGDHSPSGGCGWVVGMWGTQLFVTP
jgi:hypothetical protein